MQDAMICGTCESGQICKLKDEGFIDLCPKRKEVLKVMPQIQPSSKQKPGPGAVQKKETDGKRKRQQRRKIEDKEQFKLYHDKMI